MGKGQAQKRRLKNALKANEGNLLKASFRKASRYLPLPDAPDEKDFQEKLPASLRKLQALKSLAESQATKAKEIKDQAGRLQQKLEESEPKANPKANKRNPIPAANPSTQKASNVKQSNASMSAPTSKPVAPASSSQPQAPKLKAGQDAPMPYQEAEKKRTSKDRKKEFMRLKEKNKKKVHGELLGEKEMELLLKSKEVKFNEQADAPPNVNLKRKHWDPEAVEKKTSARVKEVFLRQLQEAEKRTALLAGQEPGIRIHKQKLKESEREGVRQQVIDAYRLSRQKGRSTNATASSLAKLVKD